MTRTFSSYYCYNLNNTPCSRQKIFYRFYGLRKDYTNCTKIKPLDVIKTKKKVCEMSVNKSRRDERIFKTRF